MGITCKECIEGFKPDDPRVRAGRYHMCGCDYCPKPSDERELEERLEKLETTVVKTIIKYEHTNISLRESSRITRLENQYISLKKTLLESLSATKGTKTKYI